MDLDKSRKKEKEDLNQSTIHPRKKNRSPSPYKKTTAVVSEAKRPDKARSYATVAAAKPAQSPERPWTEVS